MTTTYSCILPSITFAGDACNAFMEHQKYIHEMEESFLSLHESLQSEMAGKVNWYIEAKYSEIFPQIHRRSIFISTIGLLEHYLFKLNKVCQRDFFIERSLGSRANIVKIFEHFEEHISLDLSQCADTVSYLNSTYNLRNAIAHRGAVLNEDEVEILNNINDSRLILTAENELLLSKEFCIHFVSLCRLIFLLLEEPIEKRLIDIYGNWHIMNGDQQRAVWHDVQKRHNKRINSLAGSLGQ